MLVHAILSVHKECAHIVFATTLLQTLNIVHDRLGRSPSPMYKTLSSNTHANSTENCSYNNELQLQSLDYIDDAIIFS